MARYNHVFDLGFSVDTDEADGHKVTGEQLRAALRKRFSRVSDDELPEMCCWCPNETIAYVQIDADVLGALCEYAADRAEDLDNLADECCENEEEARNLYTASAQAAWDAVTAARAALKVTAEQHKPFAIPAECHSDDRVIEIAFDAADWFKLATVEEIEALVSEDWAFGYASDSVAQHFEKGPTQELFDYIGTMQRASRECGFGCAVNGLLAAEWLRENRPDVHAKLAEIMEPDTIDG